MTDNMKQLPLPFDDNQKFIGNISGSQGLLNTGGGVNRKDNFSWNKRGVALAYMTVPILHSAVDVISTNLATVPHFLKDSEGNIKWRSDTSGASQSNFLHAIEKSYGFYGVPLMELWGKSTLLYGESVIEKIMGFGSVVGLKWLNPIAISIWVNAVSDNTRTIFIDGQPKSREVKTFSYSGRYGTVDFGENEVLYSREFNPIDDVRGYSDALVALGKANISMEFDKFTLSFYNNNGHPGVIISPKDKLVSISQITEWQREWEEKFRGSGEQFKTHISSFPFDVQTFDIMDVSKPLEVSRAAEQKILVSFKVPPEMVGDTSDNSYQFSKESKNAFMQTVVRPLSLSISNAINHSGIIREFEGENLKFGFDFSEYENIAKSDLDKQDVLERQLKSGAISIGHYQRTVTGKEPVAGSDDTYLVPDGFKVVKSEALANPELIPQDTDVSGPDSNSMNQSDRATQSETGDQDSVEFFGSKSANPIDRQKEEIEIARKAITLGELQELSVKHNLSIETMITRMEEFDNDY